MDRLRVLHGVACIHLIFLTGLSHAQITAPRAWAEWEETDGVIIHQPNFYPGADPTPLELTIAEEWDSLYLDLIRGLQAEGVNIYYILDTNDRPEYHSGILDTMHLKYGIDIHDPGFKVVIGCREDYPSLTKWTRDHGPMNVYRNGTDGLSLYLFRDDVKGAGGIIRDYLGMPDTVFYNAGSGGVSSDGGNYIVDGYSMGIINGGAGAVLPEVKGYFGLDTVYALGDYLEHADYYVKLVSEESLLLSSHDRDDYVYGTEPYTYEEDSSILAGFEALFQEQVISQYGRPLKVYRIPNPPSVQEDSLKLWWYSHYASYTNSLMVNRSVFVPQFGIGESDSLALSLYREALPGYTLVPVFSRRGATGGGAVHCLTNSLAAADPVLIRHAWYCDTADIAAGYEIVANVITGSGVHEAVVHWSQDTAGAFQSLPMQQLSGDSYTATISRPEGATELHYYITATSNSGRTGIKPVTAPDHCYRIVIKTGAPGWISHLTKVDEPVSIYPNPGSDRVTVDLSGTPFLNCHKICLSLYDLHGRRVLREEFSSPPGAIELGVSHLSSGVYFLVLVDERGKFCHARLAISRN